MPLNEILGIQTNVRILRLLTEVETPLGRSEIARRVELVPTGVRRAIDDLIELGIVEGVGTGRRRPVRLREEHPLADALARLFREERERFETLLDDFRAAVRSVEEPVQGAWIESALARQRDEPGDVVRVGIATSPNEVERATTELNRLLVRIGGDHDVPIEARGYTSADLEALHATGEWDLDDVEVLHGLDPSHLLSAGDVDRESPHGEIPHSLRDRQSRELARVIAERLEQDPSLLREARRYLSKRLEEASPGEAKELREWAELLEHWSVRRIRDFLLSDSERATRLRQSLPFLHVLTPAEREQILETTEP